MIHQRAFTLLELLVVISILALLMGLLLPSLSQSRGEAEAMVCASNIRQIGLANNFYANDNHQYYCPGAADFMPTNLHRWHGMRDHPSQPFNGERGPLLPYLGSEGGIRACPSVRINLPENDPRRFEKNCGGYGYNLAFLGRQLEKATGGHYVVETDLVGAKNDRIRHPAETVMFTDSVFLSGDLIEYSFAEPRFFPTFGTRPDPSIHFRHNRQANVVWCDGHVDQRRMTFSWTSGLYPGDPEHNDIGWFGNQDDNGYFDLE
ncbi:MAG: prepilin-type N-terminal cleavage/methylation domain-containing protein [Phycisphaerae bacterium]|nr:prepilin-type N-terminal cleavage/methylation domain-containing protein [Phycisphaerae bacterium]